MTDYDVSLQLHHFPPRRSITTNDLHKNKRKGRSSINLKITNMSSRGGVRALTLFAFSVWSNSPGKSKKKPSEVSCKYERVNQQGSKRQEPTSGEEGPTEPGGGNNLLDLLLHLPLTQHTLIRIQPWQAWQEGPGPGVRPRSPRAHPDPARFRFPPEEKSPFWLPGETCEFPQVGGDLPKAAVAIATGGRLASSDFMHLCLRRDVVILTARCSCASGGDCFPLALVWLSVDATAEEETSGTPGHCRSSGLHGSGEVISTDTAYLRSAVFRVWLQQKLAF